MEPSKIKTAKLALEADGNIVGDCFILTPEKDLDKKLGILFGIVEIYNINDTFISGLWEAINDLKTEYYLPPFNLERGLEKRFEEAIARANRRIKNAVSQSIEDVDLRNLSAVLGISFGNKVFLTSTGRLKGLFARRKKNGDLLIADLLGSSAERKFKPEPDKVFANILSGELEDRDALLFINEEFLDLFPQTELADIALANSADQAVKALEDKIREKVARKNFYALAIKPEQPEAKIIAEETTPQAAMAADQETPSELAEEAPLAKPERPAIAATDPETDKINRKIQAARQTAQPQQSLERLMHTQVRTERYLNPSTMPNWQKLLIILWAWTKKASLKGWNLSRQGATYLYGLTKKQASAAIDRIADAKKNRVGPAGLEPSDKPTVKTPEPLPMETTSGQDLIIETEPEEQDELPPAMPENETDFELSVEPADEPAILSDQSLRHEPAAVAEKPAGMTSNKPAGTLTEKINSFINGKIVAFLSLKKTQQIVVVALSLLLFVFAQSIVMIGRSAEATNGALGYDKITRQIEDQLNSAEAQNIFSDEAGALAAIQKARELLETIPDKRTTKKLKQDWLDKIEAASNNLQRISYQAQPAILADFGNPDLIGLAKIGKAFWAFDNTGKTFSKFDTLTGKLTTVTSSLPPLKKLSAFDATHLIALAKTNEIYKFNIDNQTDATTKPAREYFLIKNPASKSLLIQPPLASSTIEMSMPNDNYQLFLDAGHSRIVVLDKAGSLKRQVVSPVLASSTAFASNFTEKKIWTFAEGKVYQLDIDF